MKNKYFFLWISIVIIGTSFFYTCQEKPVIVTSVTLNKDELTLEISDTVTLIATVYPNDADDKTVTWMSSNPEVASITDNGLVTAINKGETTITVITKDGKKTANCYIVVYLKRVTSVTLNKDELILTLNETEPLIATVHPDDANDKTVIWTSTNDEIATVSASGLVTAKKAGDATIIVTTKDGNKKASCKINVVDYREKWAGSYDCEKVYRWGYGSTSGRETYQAIVDVVAGYDSLLYISDREASQYPWGIQQWVKISSDGVISNRYRIEFVSGYFSQDSIYVRWGNISPGNYDVYEYQGKKLKN
ncbi:MAG: Ig domain-containing protein [Lentimicrobiaceae bacterium]|nr:Ig domain-containing protein [Lentimicrobiaceae bacterium]